MKHRKTAESARYRVDATIDAAFQLANRGFPLTHSDSNKQAILLPYTPVARQNAFQQLLYQQAWEQGFAPIPMTKPEDILTLPWPGEMVCHFHWLAPWTNEARTLEQAQDGVRRFREFTQALKEINCSICWTMHNILPHDSDWKEQDIQIRQEISEAADVVHIMAENSLALAQQYYSVAEQKVIQTQHPNYDGVYQDIVSRSTARNELEVADEDFVVLAFGAIEPYKGIDDLIRGFKLAAAKHSAGNTNLKLMIAGKCSTASLVSSLMEQISDAPNISWVNRKIPADEVQYYYRAADVVACPYKKFLNSGAALLANTFNCRLIAPNKGVFANLVTDEVGRVYENNEANNIANCIEEEFIFQREVTDPAQTRATTIANNSSEESSSSFFLALREKIENQASKRTSIFCR